MKIRLTDQDIARLVATNYLREKMGLPKINPLEMMIYRHAEAKQEAKEYLQKRGLGGISHEQMKKTARELTSENE